MVNSFYENSPNLHTKGFCWIAFSIIHLAFKSLYLLGMIGMILLLIVSMFFLDYSSWEAMWDSFDIVGGQLVCMAIFTGFYMTYNLIRKVFFLAYRKGGILGVITFFLRGILFLIFGIVIFLRDFVLSMLLDSEDEDEDKDDKWNMADDMYESYVVEESNAFRWRY